MEEHRWVCLLHCLGSSRASYYYWGTGEGLLLKIIIIEEVSSKKMSLEGKIILIEELKRFGEEINKKASRDQWG